MKYKLLSAFVFLISISITAQDANDKSFSVEASYPILFNNDYSSKGVLDLGFKYRFADLKIVKLGIGVNGSLFTDKNFPNPIATETKSKDFIIQPKVFGEFTISGIEKLRPSFGFGYSFIKTELTGISNGSEISNTFNNDGLNLNFGITYDINKTFFAQIQYDLIFLETSNQGHVEDNFNTLKLGLGFSFNKIQEYKLYPEPTLGLFYNNLVGSIESL